MRPLTGVNRIYLPVWVCANQVDSSSQHNTSLKLLRAQHPGRNDLRRTARIPSRLSRRYYSDTYQPDMDEV